MKMLIPDLFRAAEGDRSIPIRGYCQTDSYRCGLSAAWTVVHFYQPEAQFSEFCEICKPIPIWGLSIAKMKECLRYQGLHVSSKHTDLQRIEESIIDGRLILTTIGGKKQDDHWVVIYGINRAGKIMLSGATTPGFTRIGMSWKKFRKCCHSTMLIVYE